MPGEVGEEALISKPKHALEFTPNQAWPHHRPRRSKGGLQFDVIRPEGAQIADDGGLDVVMDRCIKIEHARYMGRMHWLGFNTGRIPARRGRLE